MDSMTSELKTVFPRPGSYPGS